MQKSRAMNADLCQMVALRSIAMTDAGPVSGSQTQGLLTVAGAAPIKDFPFNLLSTDSSLLWQQAPHIKPRNLRAGLGFVKSGAVAITGNRYPSGRGVWYELK